MTMTVVDYIAMSVLIVLALWAIVTITSGR